MFLESSLLHSLSETKEGLEVPWSFCAWKCPMSEKKMHPLRIFISTKQTLISVVIILLLVNKQRRQSKTFVCKHLHVFLITCLSNESRSVCISSPKFALLVLNLEESWGVCVNSFQECSLEVNHCYSLKFTVHL